MITRDQMNQIVCNMLDEVIDNSNVLEVISKAINEISYLLGRELTVNEQITVVDILKRIIEKEGLIWISHNESYILSM